MKKVHFEHGRNGYGYYSCRCNICKAANAKYIREWKGKNTTKTRGYGLKGRYGISLEQFDIILANQNGVCAICGNDGKSGKFGILHVDHCHKTERVRGLLCNTCNLAIGLMKNNPEWLDGAIKYLQVT